MGICAYVGRYRTHFDMLHVTCDMLHSHMTLDVICHISYELKTSLKLFVEFSLFMFLFNFYIFRFEVKTDAYMRLITFDHSNYSIVNAASSAFQFLFHYAAIHANLKIGQFGKPSIPKP